MKGDGNGWAAAPNGGKVWGRYGAAGLLLYAPRTRELLLQHRAEWTNEGGTWALPGGARDSHEDATAAALREAFEETGIEAKECRVLTAVVTAGPFEADPGRPELAGGWTYTTVIAATRSGLTLPTSANDESLELRWVPRDAVPGFPLLPAFAASYPEVCRELAAYGSVEP
ncbi:NUDIX hydrolase [Corynebacterium uropygiale]|uniref:NUDIX hydrolase n=1 Tax=Corynebacterium uropygiale TaxID=1775911 RepID=A0A9X1U0X2_9CORY|nr:NUDIX hydrolase [Corynebacterium uropygiale]MCF4007249.1 NUDIX hydrolase [Corynebacterium uropygiale]